MDIFDFTFEKNETKIFNNTIGVAKFGRSITIGDNLDQRNNSMGDWEITNFLKIRSTNEPNTKFVFLTPSNFFKITEFEKNKLFPNKNVEAIDYRNSKIEFTDQIKSNPIVKDIKEVWVFAGPTSKVCGSDYGIKNEKGDVLKSLYMFERYTKPLIHYLNDSSVDWYHIITDNRYFIKSYDLLNPPKKTFAQCAENFSYNYRKIKSKNDISFVEERVSVEAKDILSLWLFNKQKTRQKKFSDKKNDIAVVANQIKANGDNRFELINKFFIGKSFAKIIGKWSEPKYVEKLKDIFYTDENGVDSKELERILQDFKFGVIFNYDTPEISKKYNEHLDIKNIDWCVSKIYEYIYCGVVPIFIGFDKNKISRFYNIPNDLFVKNSNDIEKIIEKYKNEEFDNLIKSLYLNIIDENKINGKSFYLKGEFSF